MENIDRSLKDMTFDGPQGQVEFKANAECWDDETNVESSEIMPPSRKEEQVEREYKISPNARFYPYLALSIFGHRTSRT